MTTKRILNHIAGWLMAFSTIACNKSMLDELPDNRIVTNNRAASTIRIVNLGGFTQVTANGQPLTSFIVREPNDPDAQKYPGTSYFPEDGRLGSTWSVPQDLFRTDRTVQLKFSKDLSGLQAPEFIAKEETVQPRDYYLLYDHIATEGQPEYVTIERSVTQPARPDHFKIRIVNLCARPLQPVISPRGQLEDLRGPVTLTYADGTPVSGKTTGISETQRVSEYVELPYGTYQFRVLTADGRQIPGAAPVDQILKTIDPPTSTIGLNRQGEIAVSNLTFAPITTYQPGGVYTIVVAPYNFDYLASAEEARSGAIQNAFRVITDVSPIPNNVYYRLQGVNALPGTTAVSFRVNGVTLAQGLAFTKASDYGNFITGNAVVEALKADGSVLATSTQELRPAQNYTAWLYPDTTGTPRILLVPNDLSGRLIASGTTDNGNNSGASYKELRDNFMFHKRFLNLSPDYPYITFTLKNGQLAGKPTVNLQPGIPVTEEPYIRGASLYWFPYDMMAYRSAPDVVPGIWAKEVKLLSSSATVANRTLYEKAGREVPSQEPGIFTVALVGRTGNTIPLAERTQMIIVKHNR